MRDDEEGDIDYNDFNDNEIVNIRKPSFLLKSPVANILDWEALIAKEGRETIL